MDVRFGKIKATGETFNNPQGYHFEQPEENFFNAFQKKEQEPKQQKKSLGNIVPLRLNGLDSNILENKAYNDITDPILKLEHKILTLENSLSKITKDITTLQNLGYDIQLYDLKQRKKQIEENLLALNQEYAKLNLGTNITTKISSAVSFASSHKTSIQNIKIFFSNEILTKISKKFEYSQSMKEALDNLSNINESVDELIKLQTPYGENIDRYRKLTAYINKANLIHTRIASKVNSMIK